MEKPVTAAPAPVGAELDRLPLTPLHLAVLALCSFGMFCDALELAMSHVFATVFSSRGSQVPARELSLLLSAAFVGAACGAPLMGRVADRWGRRLTLQAALVGFGAMSIAAGFAPDIRALTVLRLGNGFFLGAYLPVMTIYLAELLPPGGRGRWTLIVATLGGLGGAFGSFVTRWFDHLQFADLEGWRWTLIAGGAGGLLTALFVPLLPESPRWLAAVGREADAQRQLQRFLRAARGRRVASAGAAAPVAEADAARPALWGPRYRWRTLMYFALQTVVPWVQIGFMLLTGMVFARRGLPLQDALFYVGVATAGPPVGGLLGAWIADRLERPQLLALCASGGAAMTLLFALSPVPLLAAAAAFVYNLLIAVFVTIVMLLGAELLPTAVRGTATTAGYACNRIAAMLLPMALIPFFHAAGERPPLLLLAALLVAVAAAVLRGVPRGTANRGLA